MNRNRFEPLDLADLFAIQPSLYVVSSSRLAGPLEVNASFDGIPISRRFLIEVIAGAAPFDLPAVIEVGEAGAEIMRKHSVQRLGDIHINADRTICVGVPAEIDRQLPGGRPLAKFFELYVIPYFYALAFFDEHGRWPWPARSHGIFGVMEYYAGDDVDISEADWLFVRGLLFNSAERRALADVFTGQGLGSCPCGSGQDVSKCHASLKRGFDRLSEYAGRHRVDKALESLRSEKTSGT
jgi:hypothetical protein